LFSYEKVLLLVQIVPIFMPKTEPINFKNLATVPVDVRKIILREQSKEKEKKGVAQYSIQMTIIKIIRQWENKCRE